MSKEKEKLLLSAQKLAQRGQLDKALKEYLKVIEIDRKDVKVHLKIGDLYFKLKNQEGAIKHYSEAAKYYTKDGFYSKAIAVYKRVLEIDANRDDICLQMADLYQRLGMNGDAMTMYQRIAGNYEKDGKLKEALDIYRRMAELDPKNVLNLTKLAEVYYKSGMKKEGYQAFRRALQELKEQNRFEDYVRLMEKLARADPENVENLKELCQIYLKRKAYEQAYPALVRIHTQNPEDLQNLANLAQVCAKLERKEEAINLFKELAKGYQKQGLRGKAKEALQKVLELDPNDELAKKAVGGIAPAVTEEVVELSEPAELGKEEEAEGQIEELDEAIEEEAVVSAPPEKEKVEEKLTPEQIQEHLTEADVYLKYGLRDKALTHIQSVLKSDPENIEAFKRLKNIELDAKNQAGVIETLQKISSLAEKKQDWKSLLESAREILQLNPDNIDAERWLKKADAELETEKKAATAQPPPAPQAEEPEEIEAVEVPVEIEEEVVVPSVEKLAAEPAKPPVARAPEKTAVVQAPSKPVEMKAPEEPKEMPKSERPAEVIDLKEEFEEAEFYVQQGLEEEALRVYLEILKKDPKNKQALSRVKELEEKAQAKLGEAVEEEVEIKLEPKIVSEELKAQQEEIVEEGEVLEEEEVPEQPPLKAEERLETGIDFGVKAEAEEKAKVEEKEELEVSVKAKPEPEEKLIEEEVMISAEESIEAKAEESKAEEELEVEIQAKPKEVKEKVVEEERPVSSGEGLILEKPVPLPISEEPSAEVGLEERVEESAVEEPVMSTEPEVSTAEPARVEISADSEPVGAVISEPAGGEEEGLFDLAAELEKEDLGPAPSVSGLSTSEKYSFEDMFKSFKEGVSKQVSEDDAATHYDLGIAYKEMGLYDDAEQEFRIALRAGHNVSDCHLMIGLCHSERGRYEKAIEEFEAGVSVPGVTDKEKTALFYELAQAWLGLGDLNKALKMFEKTQTLDPGFREVSARIEELKARLSGAKPSIPPAPSREEVSWESAALQEPEPGREGKSEEEKAEEGKKKKSQKISYV